MYFRASALCLSLLASLTTVAAQEPQPKPASQPQASAAASKPTAKKKSASAAAKARAEEQKAMALSLLVSLATDARSFPDQTLRARTLARIADALWEPDPDQGRTLFRRAWDAATVADQESGRKLEEERKKQEAATGSYAIARGPDLRAEVLRLAARRDRALGEELLEKMTEAKKQEAIEATSRRDGPPDTPAAQQQRLRLAGQLLEADVERAIQFADPALTNVTMEGLNFLSLLREKNSEAADLRYARMLTLAQNDLHADANTVSLLSSYLFTPNLFIVFGPDGGQNSSQTRGRTPPPDGAPELRAAYMQTAARILLRPSASRELDTSSSGLQGKYLVIRRLMPLFEQYAPKEIVDQLKAEMAVLAQSSNRNLQDEDDEGLRRGLTPERSSEEMEQSLLDRLDRAKTAEERDGIYLMLAIRAADKGDMRARDFADKIEDTDMRKQAKPYVDMTLAINAVDKKEFDKALTLASIADLSHIQRVWLLTQAAKQMPPSAKEKALETIESAAAEARRIGGSEPDRSRALVAVANAYLAIDRPRAWETMLEVARASKSAEGFTGEDGRLILSLRSKTQNSLRTNSVADFNLTGVFRALAQDDADQAVELARSFEREAPRSTALIAVARTLLGDQGR